jgi:metal-responsive CopG/Arc/MetJ family transcriptional regulator
MPKRRQLVKKMRTTIDLPEELIEDLDALADESDESRTDVIEALLEYCFEHQEIIDEVFPIEEAEEEEVEEEEAEEAESEA